MVEIWKDVNGYEGCYQISNLGRLKSLSRYVNYANKGKKLLVERIMKEGVGRGGYVHHILSRDGNKKMIKLHRIVATAFLPNPKNYPMVNHLDSNPSNNKLDNLEWCDQSMNMTHANIGIYDNVHKVNRVGKKITSFEVRVIRRYRAMGGKMKGYEIAKKYDVSTSLISMIINKKIWGTFC